MVRVLFTFAGGSGHANPLVPIASAVKAAGHIVAFAGHHSGAAVPEAQGFAVFTDPAGATSTTPSIIPLLALDMDREYRVVRDFYAGHLAHDRATRLLDLSTAWRPDLVVCDEMDFGSMIAAERRGLPHVTILVIAAGSFARPEVIAEPLDMLRAEHGLPPDPAVVMPSRYLVLSPFPPSFRDPADPLPRTAYSLRSDMPGPSASDSIPEWLSCLPDRPTVYLTLGTVFNRESGDLFTRVLAGLRDLAVTVIVTVGRDIDPTVFGPQPDNVHSVRYIPQAVLLPHCDCVVNHGGSGSVIGALAHGLPLVTIPMGADQALNADRAERLGVGIALDAVQATPQSVREAVSTILSDPNYRLSARRIRDEIAALPEPHMVVPLLERLIGDEDVAPPA